MLFANVGTDAVRVDPADRQCHPMILTPTPGAFDLDLDELNSRMIGLKRSRPPASPASPVIGSAVVHEPQLEWDSREDGIVQSVRTRGRHG